MRDKEIFIYVDNLGDLYIYDVLLSYIYPRVFVCEDIFDCKYLFYEVSDSDEVDNWLVTKITEIEYYSIVDQEKSIQEVYKNKAELDVFVISKVYGREDVISLTLDCNKWLKKLPKNPVYAENEIFEKIDVKMNRPWIYLENTGWLYKDIDLITFDIPLLFVCKTINNERYLVLCVDEELLEYVLVKVSNRLLVSMLTNKITMEETFRASELGLKIICDSAANCFIEHAINPDNISEDELPDKGEYFSLSNAKLSGYVNRLANENGIFRSLNVEL